VTLLLRSSNHRTNEKRPALWPVAVERVSAPLERQSHWFKVALPSKTAVPLVFDLARRRDLLRRADTLFDSNSKSKVTSRTGDGTQIKSNCHNDLQTSSGLSLEGRGGLTFRCVLISYLVIPSNGKLLLHRLRPWLATVFHCWGRRSGCIMHQPFPPATRSESRRSSVCGSPRLGATQSQ